MFIATFLRGNTNYEGNDWIYPGLVTYSRERMVELGQEAGFVCTSVGWPHHQGQAWIAFLHPENSRLATSATAPSRPDSIKPRTLSRAHIFLYPFANPCGLLVPFRKIAQPVAGGA